MSEVDEADDMDVVNALAVTPTPEPVAPAISREPREPRESREADAPLSLPVDLAKTYVGLADAPHESFRASVTEVDRAVKEVEAKAEVEPTPEPAPVEETKPEAVVEAKSEKEEKAEAAPPAAEEDEEDEQDEDDDEEEDEDEEAVAQPASSTAAVVSEVDPLATGETPAAKLAPSVSPDEVSIPPVSELGDDEEDEEAHSVHEEFFSEKSLAAATARESGEPETWSDVGGEAAAKAKRKAQPEVVARRQKFSRYVKWAVGGMSILCLAAAIRSASTPSNSWFKAQPHEGKAVAAAAPIAPAAPAEKAATPKPEETAAQAQPASTTEPVPPMPGATGATGAPAAKTDEAKPAEAKADEAKAEAKTDEAKPADAKPAEAKADEANAKTAPGEAAKPAEAATAAAATDEKPAKTAAEEKKDAIKLLERGKAGDAIAAAKRSVALDPEDGEAWLYLGAAYQEKGNFAEAQKAYVSCVKEGKRGPKSECQAMLH